MITDTRAYAEQHGVGLQEAKRAVTKLNRIERLERLRSRSRYDCSVITDILELLIEDAKN
jgi:hypothetical protein